MRYRFWFVLFIGCLFPVWGMAGVQEGYDYLKKGEYEKAIAELEPVAKTGDGNANFYMGYIYENGLGVEANLAIAWDWYNNACENRSVRSCVRVAEMFEGATGVDQNYARALMYYEKAEELGDVSATRKIGKFYLDGKLGARDIDKAKMYFEKAISEGDNESQKLLDNIANIDESSDILVDGDDQIKKIVKNLIENYEKSNQVVCSFDKLNIGKTSEISKISQVLISNFKMKNNKGYDINFNDLTFDIKEISDNEFKFYDFKTSKGIFVHDMSGAIVAYIKARSAKLDVTWNPILSIFTGTDADFAGVEIASKSQPIFAKIAQMSFTKKSVKLNDQIGVMDVNDDLQIKGIRIAKAGSGDMVNIARFTTVSKMKGFNPANQKKLAEKMAKYINSSNMNFTDDVDIKIYDDLFVDMNMFDLAFKNKDGKQLQIANINYGLKAVSRDNKHDDIDISFGMNNKTGIGFKQALLDIAIDGVNSKKLWQIPLQLAQQQKAQAAGQVVGQMVPAPAPMAKISGFEEDAVVKIKNLNIIGDDFTVKSKGKVNFKKNNAPNIDLDLEAVGLGSLALDPKDPNFAQMAQKINPLAFMIAPFRVYAKIVGKGKEKYNIKLNDKGFFVNGHKISDNQKKVK